MINIAQFRTYVCVYIVTSRVSNGLFFVKAHTLLFWKWWQRRCRHSWFHISTAQWSNISFLQTVNSMESIAASLSQCIYHSIIRILLTGSANISRYSLWTVFASQVFQMCCKNMIHGWFLSLPLSLICPFDLSLAHILGDRISSFKFHWIGYASSSSFASLASQFHLNS